jgi:hypothetical protein
MVADEAVRRALAELFQDNYLVEYGAGFELTERGDHYIYGRAEPTATS